MKQQRRKGIGNLPQAGAAAGVLACLVCLALPAGAETKPGDQIQIMNLGDVVNDPEKIYAKPWSAIKLDPKTRARIVAINAKLDKDGYERFRLSWIRLVHNEVQAVIFQGNRSTTTVYDFSKPATDPASCYVTLAGNGGFGYCQ